MDITSPTDPTDTMDTAPLTDPTDTMDTAPLTDPMDTAPPTDPMDTTPPTTSPTTLAKGSITLSGILGTFPGFIAFWRLICVHINTYKNANMTPYFNVTPELQGILNDVFHTATQGHYTSLFVLCRRLAEFTVQSWLSMLNPNYVSRITSLNNLINDLDQSNCLWLHVTTNNFMVKTRLLFLLHYLRKTGNNAAHYGMGVVMSTAEQTVTAKRCLIAVYELFQFKPERLPPPAFPAP